MVNTHVLIADSSSLIVFGMETLLHQRPGTVVSAALCRNDLVQIAGDQQPDIIIAGEQIDPSLDPQMLVAELQRAAPKSRLVLVGYLRDGLLIHDLLAMGVRGYLCISDDLCGTLYTAIETVLKDRLYLSPTPNAEYLISTQNGTTDWKLDDQARAVLRFLAQGYSIGHIAYHLRISLRRAYWERQKLRRRFGASTNEHLIQRALEEGFALFTD